MFDVGCFYILGPIGLTQFLSFPGTHTRIWAGLIPDFGSGRDCATNGVTGIQIASLLSRHYIQAYSISINNIYRHTGIHFIYRHTFFDQGAFVLGV